MINDEKNINNVNGSSNMFDDNLFNTSSDSLFGSADNLFGSANDLFSNNENVSSNVNNNEGNNQSQENSLEEQPQEINTLQNEPATLKDTKTESNKKVKKEKSKDKKKRNHKKLFIILGVIVLVMLLAAAGVCGILYYKKISVKLATPTLKIDQINETVVLNATENLKAEKYEFVVSQDDGTEFSIVTKSNKKELNLSNYKKLTVKVRCLGKISKAHSNYSVTKTVYNKVKLKMSTVFVDGLTEVIKDDAVVGYKTNNNYQDDYLSWESVKNASKYYVYYKADIEKDEVSKFEVQQAQGTITFGLSQVYSAGGAGCYNISVVAIPENEEYFEASDYYNVKVIEYFAQQDKVLHAELDNTNMLTIYTNNTSATKFALTFNYGVVLGVVEHQIIVEDLNKENAEYLGNPAIKYSVNISEFIKNELQEISIIVLGDGKYSTNSESFVIN